MSFLRRRRGFHTGRERAIDSTTCDNPAATNTPHRETASALPRPSAPADQRGSMPIFPGGAVCSGDQRRHGLGAARCIPPQKLFRTADFASATQLLSRIALEELQRPAAVCS
jgi:hypothetical protein